MVAALPRFDQAQVLVVGDVMLDRYWHGAAARISPEAPVPVVQVRGRDDRPGGAANVALNIAALGAGATLAGLTGADEAAELLHTRLASAGVEVSFQQQEQPTITKLRVISRNQQLLRVDFEEPFDPAQSEQLMLRASRLLQPMGALVLSDYAKGALEQPQALIAAARRVGIPVLVDPKGTDFSRYRGATLLTPNLGEFEQVVGPCPTEAILLARGQTMMEELELSALLITRGEQGLTLLQPGQQALHLPTRAREVFDVTGAGDTVIAVLGAAVAAGEALPQAVALANLAAGLVVAKLGTAVVSAPELRRALQATRGTHQGAMSQDQLVTAVADARAQGERIVFTNGCFDIIHAGHVGYLEQARRLGDRLIVAVNGDASVTRLKGPGRPINAVERRMAVLAGLESVDWVVAFDDDTPEALLQRLQPEVLVKGGDYAPDQVVGWEIVTGYGGEVRVLSFFDDCSTTAIVQKVLEQHRD